MILQTPLTKENIDEITSKWGRNKQIDVLVEEMSEIGLSAMNIIHTTMRIRRKTGFENIESGIILPNDREHLSEEIADALMMMDQIVQMYGLEKDVIGYIDKKYKRVLQRLAEKND